MWSRASNKRLLRAAAGALALALLAACSSHAPATRGAAGQREAGSRRGAAAPEREHRYAGAERGRHGSDPRRHGAPRRAPGGAGRL